MSTTIHMTPEHARFRSEVDVDGDIIWIRVDFETVSISLPPEFLAKLRAALDQVLANRQEAT